MGSQGTSGTQAQGAQVLVGITSTEVVGMKDDRMFCLIVNDGATNVYLALGRSATLNAGILLAPGSAIWMGRATDMPYVGIISGISTAPTNLTVVDV